MIRLMRFLLVLTLVPALALPGAASAQPVKRIFQDPIGVAVDAGGTVYVTDQLAAQVVKLSPSGTVLARFGTQGTKPGQLNVPGGISADTTGHLYVADTWNRRIEKFSSSGQFLAAWRSTPARSFFRPLSVANDRAGNVYVTDNEVDSVYRLSPRGKLLKRLGQFGNPTQGQFRGPTAVAVDRQGTLYVASYNWVYKVSATGKTVAVWGTLRPGRFYLPGGLATDAQGNVYVADTGNKRVQELSPSGAPLRIWGGGGSGIRFGEPNGVAVDARGDIYVTDLGNRRVVKLSARGVVLAVWR